MFYWHFLFIPNSQRFARPLAGQGWSGPNSKVHTIWTLDLQHRIVLSPGIGGLRLVVLRNGIGDNA